MINAVKSQIAFSEPFMQISQFYIDKKGMSQTKQFEIKVKGVENGQAIQLG